MTISHGDRVIAEIKPTAGDIADEDPLYAQAVSIVRDMEKTSISHLQRVLKIGYNRAACLIESMENRGVVSPPNAAGTRTILSY
ncbi:MAG: DNA translocase FtsK [Pseudoxanthomonas sp.]